MTNKKQNHNSWEKHCKNLDISKNAMLIEFSFTALGNSRKVSELADKITEEKNCDSEAVKVTKSLFHRDDLKNIRTIRSNARRFIRKHTLPWGKNAERLLPAKMFNKFSEEVESFRIQFDSAIASFEEKYPQLLDENKQRLGDLFRPEDYPTPEEVKACFTFSVNYLPVPIESDFRVEIIGEAVTKKIKTGIDDLVQHKVAEAEGDMLAKMLKKVRHLSERLTDQKGHFKDASLEAIREIATIVNDLNFTDNKEITKIVESLNDLTEVKPEEIRDDESVKNDVLKSANQIVEKIEGIM